MVAWPGVHSRGQQKYPAFTKVEDERQHPKLSSALTTHTVTDTQMSTFTQIPIHTYTYISHLHPPKTGGGGAPKYIHILCTKTSSTIQSLWGVSAPAGNCLSNPFCWLPAEYLPSRKHQLPVCQGCYFLPRGIFLYKLPLLLTEVSTRPNSSPPHPTEGVEDLLD